MDRRDSGGDYQRAAAKQSRGSRFPVYQHHFLGNSRLLVGHAARPSRAVLVWLSSTARRGELQVRVLEPATSLHVSLLLDVRGFGFGIYHQQLLELTLSALASIGVFLQTQGAPLSFLANTSPPVAIPPAASVPHLQQFLESLARLNPAPGPSLVPWALEHLPRGNTAVLTATDISPDINQSIARLEEAGFHVVLLLAIGDDRALSSRLPGRDLFKITPACDLAARLEGRA